jgi:hypothetical protein
MRARPLASLWLRSLALAGACFALLISVPRTAPAYELANGYWSLSGSDGVITSLRMDPQGRGAYGENLVKYVAVGAWFPEMGGVKAARRDGNSLVLEGVTATQTHLEGQELSGIPVELEEGDSMGAVFQAQRPMFRIQAAFPTWGTPNGGLRWRLIRLAGQPRLSAGAAFSPDGGRVVAEGRVRNHPDNTFADLPISLQPAGWYYLVVDEPVGRIGWWSRAAQPEGVFSTAIRNGRVDTDVDPRLRIESLETLVGTWTISLDDSRLRTQFVPDEQGAEVPDTRVVTAWEREGYDLSQFPFIRFHTARG